MFSSTFQDIQQDTVEVAAGIASKTQVVASGDADDAKEAFEAIGDRAHQEDHRERQTIGIIVPGAFS